MDLFHARLNIDPTLWTGEHEMCINHRYIINEELSGLKCNRGNCPRIDILTNIADGVKSFIKTNYPLQYSDFEWDQRKRSQLEYDPNLFIRNTTPKFEIYFETFLSDMSRSESNYRTQNNPNRIATTEYLTNNLKRDECENSYYYFQQVKTFVCKGGDERRTRILNIMTAEYSMDIRLDSTAKFSPFKLKELAAYELVNHRKFYRIPAYILDKLIKSEDTQKIKFRYTNRGLRTSVKFRTLLLEAVLRQSLRYRNRTFDQNNTYGRKFALFCSCNEGFKLDKCVWKKYNEYNHSEVNEIAYLTTRCDVCLAMKSHCVKNNIIIERNSHFNTCIDLKDLNWRW